MKSKMRKLVALFVVSALASGLIGVALADEGFGWDHHHHWKKEAVPEPATLGLLGLGVLGVGLFKRRRNK
jgi:hypothetical protein